MPERATLTATVREDVFACAKMIQDHERAIQTIVLQDPKRGERLRTLATELFDLLDDIVTDRPE